MLRALADGAEGRGGVFDTAAGYGGGASEDLAGDWAIDNLGGGRGRLPTQDHLRRMVELVEALPAA